MTYQDYRKILGLNFSDEEKIKLFLAKAYIGFAESIELDNYLSAEEFNNFCFNAGIKVVPEYFSSYAERSKVVFDFFKKETNDLNRFLYYFTILLNASKTNSPERKQWQKAISFWASESELDFEFLEDGEKVFILSRGAKELDDALVSQPLEWLKGYPLAHKAFIKALKDYSSATEETASEVADSLRKALETFFQEFFNNSKSLENYKSEYGDYLKSHGIPAEIANDFNKLLDSFTNYNNNYAKHHDKSSINVLEYLLYQTGNIIRFLITLKKEDKS
ncbi:TPA: hypothetical protein IAC10_04825 [Candidatus Scatousia excrementigallinarum]|uniref:Uncharacterized protein n=1 Tax=Candidatus Scatousia excrementigallinarum TaxID=2840935 RepID=A0A9D1EYQ1_9BACT|nr:hypothetical protein [Candidatus Scatousia excrementigallinarum]